MINYKNTAENIAIFFLGAILGAFISFVTVIKTTDNIIQQMTPTINHAIDKETIKNEIKNEIDLKIDKIKKSDSLRIIIDQKPVNNQEPINVIQNDTMQPVKEKKPNLWNRIFRKKKNTP